MASGDVATLAARSDRRRLVAILARWLDLWRLVPLGLGRRRRALLVGLVAHFCFPSLGLGGGLVGPSVFGGGWCPLSFLGDFGGGLLADWIV